MFGRNDYYGNPMAPYWTGTLAPDFTDPMSRHYYELAQFETTFPNNETQILEVTAYYWICVKDNNFSSPFDALENMTSPAGVTTGGSLLRLYGASLFDAPGMGVFFKVFKTKTKRVMPGKQVKFRYKVKSGRGRPGTYFRPAEFEWTPSTTYLLANVSRGITYKVTPHIWNVNATPATAISETIEALPVRNSGARTEWRFNYRVTVGHTESTLMNQMDSNTDQTALASAYAGDSERQYVTLPLF